MRIILTQEELKKLLRGDTQLDISIVIRDEKTTRERKDEEDDDDEYPPGEPSTV